MQNKFSLSPIAIIILLMSTSIFRLNAKGVDFEWAKNMGGNDVGYGNGVAVDALGNVYTIGYFQGTADFDPGTAASNITSAGAQDIFILKLDAAGNFVWAKSIGGTGNDQGFAIATDTTGNIYVTGFFTGTVDFDPGSAVVNLSAVSGVDVFIAKFEANGKLSWAKGIGGNGWDQSSGIKVDDNGNVYTVGYFQRTVDFDPGTAVTNLVSAGGFDVFISKLNNAGDFVWARQLGGGSSDFGASISIGMNGDVYTTGFFTGSADFDPGSGVSNFNSAGGYDIFVSKLDSNGNYGWANSFGSTTEDQGYCIASDLLGNVYISGYFSGTVDFDPGNGNVNLTSAGNADIFLTKLNNTGGLEWARRVGGTDNDYANGIAIDGGGNPCLVGYFNSTVDFDPEAGTDMITSSGADDIFVTKISAAGNYLWAKKMGGLSNDYGFGIAVNRAGSVYTTGMFNGVVNFNPSEQAPFNLNSDNGGHIFVQKMYCTDTSSSIMTQTTCDSFSFIGETYTTSGKYTKKMVSTTGCDSTLTLNLTINSINPAAINIKGFTLGTTSSYQKYQWYLNDKPITGATDSSYTVDENGKYKVAVSDEKGCIDTSDEYEVTNVTGITNLDALNQSIRIFPNPAQEIIHIISPVKLNIVLCSIDGKIIMKSEHTSVLNIQDLESGIYFLQIRDSAHNLVRTQKMVKN